MTLQDFLPGNLKPSQLPSRTEVRKQVQIELARRKLLHFNKYTFADYQVTWHGVLLCDYLDRFVEGDITRLIVLMPPRHSKSEHVSRRLPAYILGRFPNARIIAASYGADLASRMNRDVQRIIDSPEYAEVFPNTRLFGKNIRTIADGSYLRNSDIFEVVGHRGVYRGAGIGGGITGMGFDFGIIDDPIKNRKEANSKVYRDGVWDWFTSTFFTRQEKDARILITLTPWHPDDLAGRILKDMRDNPDADKWTVLKLPAIAEEPLAEYDLRQPGQALWPDKYTEAQLDSIRRTVGLFEWNALYQCRPQPREGGLFKWADIDQNRATDPPDFIRVVIGVDPSGSADGDEVGIVVAGLGRDKHAYVLADLSLHASSDQWARTVVSAYQTYRADRIVAEKNYGGDMVENTIRTVGQRVSYKGVTATRGKELRAEPISALYEQRKVHHVGEFGALEDEMTMWRPGDDSPNRLDALVWTLTELMLGPSTEATVHEYNPFFT